MKRQVLFILTVLLVLALPLCGWAQFSFTTNSGAITITGYSGSGGNVTIPSTTNGYPVTGINDLAFLACYSLTNITIPNSVTKIGNSAFQSCENLRSVFIPSNATNLGDSVFGYCYSMTNITVDVGNLSFTSADGVLFNKNMTKLIECPAGLTGSYSIPNSVTNVAYAAFLYCSKLTNLIIANSVTRIDTQAFCGCSGLTSVTIPNSVSSFGFIVFVSCSNLRQAFFLGNAPNVDPDPGSGISDSVFYLDYGGTVYYLPGNTGWSSSFGGWPTKLWNPQIQTTNGNFAIKTNRFGFDLTGTANIPIVIEGSTNLIGPWTLILNGTLTNGSIYFSDSQWTNYPKRFYRVRSP